MEYKLLDNSDPTYPIVESNKYGRVTVHPDSKFVIEDDWLICDDNPSKTGIDDIDSHHHAIRCRCSRCKGSLSELLGMMASNGVKIVDSSDKQAVNDLFDSFKKK